MSSSFRGIKISVCTGIRDEQKLDELESSIVYGNLALLQLPHLPITGSFDFAHYKRIH